MAGNVKRTLVIPQEVDHALVDIAEQAGMTVDQLMSYLAKQFVQFPTSVLKTYMTDLFRRMNLKAGA